MAKPATQTVQCYLCGHEFTVSMRTMSTTCPKCHKAIKVEDLLVKSYIPVNDLQTCGRIKITKRGRVAAKRIQCGGGIDCEGTMEGSVQTNGQVRLGPKACWKGKILQSRTLAIADGAKLLGLVTVPPRPEPPARANPHRSSVTTTPKTATTIQKRRSASSR